MITRSSTLFLVTLTALLTTGCATAVRSAVDTATATAGRQVGERVGEMAAAMVLASFPDSWTPQWRSLYVSYLFGVAFHSGSYAPAGDAYRPGDWTRWRMLDGTEASPAMVERAFLARTDEGEEWWRVAYENTEDGEAIILEGLFTAGRSELLRLRGRFPGEEQAEELPVEEGTYGYARPTRLTQESLEGATVGSETVTVPAGTFRTRHVRYAGVGATLEWWLEEQVPGGVVKYTHRDGTPEGEPLPGSWAAELAAYGDDAESKLGVADR